MVPDRTYRPPDPTSPRRVDRLLAHPFELVWSAWSIVTALLMFGDLVWEGFNPIPSLEDASPILQATIALAMLAGGVAVQWSFSGRRMDLGDLWALERAGLQLLAGGWGIYTAAVVIAVPNRLVQSGIGFAVVLALTIRWVAVGLVMRQTRETQRKLRGGGTNVG